MRTTLDIDDDVLAAARERAQRERKTIGAMVSELARQSLVANRQPDAVHEPAPVYGFVPFSGGSRLVTNADVDQLRNDDAY